MAGSPLPPGFRFHPSDEELLVHYLKRKVVGKFVDEWIVGDLDIYKYEPAELPDMAVLRSRDSQWFFFNPPDKRQLHGSRTNRTTKGGYWKATGRDRRITAGSCVGLKKTLIFYCGRAPHGKRTDWVMHEYRLDDGAKTKKSSPDSVVLCRVRRKSGLGPRNGEQYGAPVLEEEEEEEEERSISVNNIHLSSSISEKAMAEAHIQEVPPITTFLERVAKEDVNVFVQNLLSLEEMQGDHNPEEDLMMDELLSLLNDQSDVSLKPTTSSQLMDMDSCNIDDSQILPHGANNGSVTLEDLLQFVSDQHDKTPEHLPGLQVPSHKCHSDHLQDVGFLELADLDEALDIGSPPGFAALENLTLELDACLESSPSTSHLQDELQLQENVQRFGYREDIRDLWRAEVSGMNNESEVPLDSSQCLNVLERVQTRSLSLKNDDLPSGLVSCPGQERGLALINAHSVRAQEQPEARHVKVNKYEEYWKLLLGSAASEESGVETLERHVNNITKAAKDANFEVGSMSDDNNRSVCPAPHRPSPSTMVRVISGFLGKISALPALAGELPLEWEQQLPEKQSSLSFLTESKIQHLSLRDPASVSINGSSLTLKVEFLSPLQHEKQIQNMPERAPQWSVSSVAILDGYCRSFVNGFSDRTSMFLFCITTLALILSCIFRSFCRSSRVAFA